MFNASRISRDAQRVSSIMGNLKTEFEQVYSAFDKDNNIAFNADIEIEILQNIPENGFNDDFFIVLKDERIKTKTNSVGVTYQSFEAGSTPEAGTT